jgi:hypothetical protein
MRKLVLLALLASLAAANTVQDCRDSCLSVAREAYSACMADGSPQHVCWNMLQKSWHDCTHACAGH